VPFVPLEVCGHRSRICPVYPFISVEGEAELKLEAVEEIRELLTWIKAVI
jgi:hypothetical protein